MEVRCIWIKISAFCRDIRQYSCSSCFILKEKYPLPFCFGVTCLDAGLIPELVRSCDEEVHPLNMEHEIELFCVPKNNCDCQKTDTWYTVKYGRTYKEVMSDSGLCDLPYDWLLNGRFVSAVKWTQILTFVAFVKCACRSVLLCIRFFGPLCVSFAGMDVFNSGSWRTRSVALLWSEMTAIPPGLYK